ncbi:rod shape-determining protein RodA [Oceanobacillus saliphilus]|uniref:rod shape-determining protein RodA n=1 Tax=Oceanobacillus saliphilus TaxID=2925834 RepID=UPI00201E33E5|nr:rod shape-determining protein RodA [Oceanobacillus saliphilus]
MLQRPLRIDYTLLSIIICLFIFSLLAVNSGSGQYNPEDPYYFVIRQVIWYILGFTIMIGVALFDYELLEKWALPLYAAGVGLLLLVHFFGTTKNGSQRWISLGFIEVQPSEFMKIFLILALAATLSRIGKDRISFKKSIPITIKSILLTVVPFVLILVQPDLGSALMIAAVSITLIFISSISSKMISLLLISMTAMLGFLIFLYRVYFDIFTTIFKPHQLGRIYGWLSPQEFGSGYGYQLQQSMLGIGSGQITGAGFNQGVQVQNGKIPEAHTDFIFAVIGEEFGFIGASILIFLYFLLIYRIITIALKANNLFGVYICVGVIGLIASQVFQNIGMTIGIMPITGLALPFLSYGGSALFTNMMALGLVISVHLRSKDYMFSNKTT